jgi:hypothetical protein
MNERKSQSFSRTGKNGFSISLVPTLFSPSSHGFFSCSQFVPHVLDIFLSMFPIALSLIPYALANVVLLSPL